jgi:hypothetical protein
LCQLDHRHIGHVDHPDDMSAQDFAVRHVEQHNVLARA